MLGTQWELDGNTIGTIKIQHPHPINYLCKVNLYLDSPFSSNHEFLFFKKKTQMKKFIAKRERTPTIVVTAQGTQPNHLLMKLPIGGNRGFFISMVMNFKILV
jgi:hypothetical protein